MPRQGCVNTPKARHELRQAPSRNGLTFGRVGYKMPVRGVTVIIGLLFAASLLLLGLGAGYRQIVVLRRVRAEPFMAIEDRTYYRRQSIRRLGISFLLLILSAMIVAFYAAGMDARMDAIPERGKDDPQFESDKEFTRQMAVYWLVVTGSLGVFAFLAVLDVWATRKYWMRRYRELKTEHEIRLRRDLALFRQQKLNERAPGLKKPDPADSEDENG